MKLLRQLGSLFFVVGLFTTVFGGIPWYVIVADDPVVPWWLRLAVFSLLGGILAVLLTLALDHRARGASVEEARQDETGHTVLLQNAAVWPGRDITETIGLVQGHTVFAIWLGQDLSALLRLILGGELTEYTEMLGRARSIATLRMTAKAAEMGADAVINVRYMTTSVVGSAAELLVYGTAVKLS